MDGRVPSLEQMPEREKRFLRNAMLPRVIEYHEGMHDALSYLYRGTVRPDGSRVPWTIRGHEAWALLQEDCLTGFYPKAIWKAQRTEER